MKHKLLIKSLFHAAQIAEQIKKLEESQILSETIPEVEFIRLYTGCKEKNGHLYNQNGYLLSCSGLQHNLFYIDQFSDYYEVEMYFKISESTFVRIDSWHFINNEDGSANVEIDISKKELPKFLKTIYQIATLKKQLDNILSRKQVKDGLDIETFTSFTINGFERNCIERNHNLYDCDGNYIAEEVDFYYVNQSSGYCEDDYYGALYYKISDGLFVRADYSC